VVFVSRASGSAPDIASAPIAGPAELEQIPGAALVQPGDQLLENGELIEVDPLGDQVSRPRRR
jgi:hypothetical protein